LQKFENSFDYKEFIKIDNTKLDLYESMKVRDIYISKTNISKPKKITVSFVNNLKSRYHFIHLVILFFKMFFKAQIRFSLITNSENHNPIHIQRNNILKTYKNLYNDFLNISDSFIHFLIFCKFKKNNKYNFLKDKLFDQNLLILINNFNI